MDQFEVYLKRGIILIVLVIAGLTPVLSGTLALPKPSSTETFSGNPSDNATATAERTATPEGLLTSENANLLTSAEDPVRGSPSSLGAFADPTDTLVPTPIPGSDSTELMSRE